MKERRVYFNYLKQYYLLITSIDCGTIHGYTSRFNNPSMIDKMRGYNIEKLGAFNFGDFSISFGNIFRKNMLQINPYDFQLHRVLTPDEFDTFMLINEYVKSGKIYNISISHTI